MASIPYLCSIDLNGNELENAAIQNLAVAPTSPVVGQFYYNTATDSVEVYDGTGWVNISGQLQSITTGTPAVQIDNTDPANPIINVLDATAINSGLMSAAHFTLLNNATSAATPDTLVIRDANGDASFNVLTATELNGLAAPVDPDDAVNKAYVDSLIASGMKIVGGIDASTDPNYPAGSQGDAYYVTAAGHIGGPSGPLVEPGDLVLTVATTTAGGDHATVGTDFIILENNNDYATTLTDGTIRIATQAEVDAGTDNATAVTPLTLATLLANYGSGNVSQYTQLVGDGTNTAFAVTHNFNNQPVEVQVYDAATGQKVQTCISQTDADTATVTFNQAPATNAYNVVVQGVDLA